MRNICREITDCGVVEVSRAENVSTHTGQKSSRLPVDNVAGLVCNLVASIKVLHAKITLISSCTRDA